MNSKLYEEVRRHDKIYSLMYSPAYVEWLPLGEQIVEISASKLQWAADGTSFYYVWGGPGPDFNHYDMTTYGKGWAYSREEIFEAWGAPHTTEYEIIALMGKAGAGKDFILRSMLDCYPSLHEIVSCTTRPPREGEADGVNYHFLKEPLDVSYDIFMEYTNFNGWTYGTRWQDLKKDKINIGVFNPTGVRSLLKWQTRGKIRTKVFYVTASDKLRLLRQLNREENPNVKEIVRRYGADEQDFADLSDIAYTTFENEGALDRSMLKFICH